MTLRGYGSASTCAKCCACASAMPARRRAWPRTAWQQERGAGSAGGQSLGKRFQGRLISVFSL
ncbi:MAG: hypothetical protein BCS36_05610 [Desulfovibrio sp. MES5]|nr:MAG: hypothetical protein BCS36_05610 [Desulfovibrio sp. MES5]